MLSTRAVKFVAAVVAAGVTLLGATTPSRAQTTGTIELHLFKVGFIAGIRSGNGELSYRGRTDHLRVRGAELVSVGAAAVELTGTASNLRSPASISGTYRGSGIGAALGGGGQLTTLRNRNGVVLRLRGVQIGLQASLGLARLRIALR
jgi:hypothetical protein